jgi:hypothetical protein
LTVPPEHPAAAFVEVSGLAPRALERLERGSMTDDEWRALLKVTVRADDTATRDDRPAMLGTYSVEGSVLRFTPRFPLDAGREYAVTFDPSRIPGAAPGSQNPIVAVLSRPKTAPTMATRVERIYPSGDVLPENQLRLYVQFSAPMGRRSGLEHVHLIDDEGREVKDPFLPLDVEFWNGDRTRYTFFFDPGRVKKGITPRNEMGPSLVEETFRREVRVSAPDERPIDPNRWRVTPPTARTRDPLVVTFEKPLDHGLLLRALGVAQRDEGALDGEVRIEGNETRWTFTPANAWAPDDYNLVALSILEDRAGNRIGRAFEVDRFDEIDPRADLERTLLPFRIGVSSTN